MKASKRTALLTVVLGIAGTLAGSAATWFAAPVPSVVAMDDIAVTGSTASPVIGALVLVSAAAVLAQLLARGVVARAMGAVVALAGAGAAIAALMALGDRESIVQRAASAATGVPTLAGDLETSAWPYVTVGGALVLLVGGALLTMVAPRSAAAPGDRYTRKPANTRAPSASDSPIDDWDALSEGRDPSAPPPGQASR